jgi:MoxR-like ATPase
MPEDWRIYRGESAPHDGIRRLPPPPPWRRFRPPGGGPDGRNGDLERARSYRADRRVIDRVNAALQLRRPLLVTGKPGCGKSTLAYSIAYELGLGPVLCWMITSRSTLRDGLYHYDAVGRVHEAALPGSGGAPDIGGYIRLGPLGTALLPGDRPRVLLVDELDKADVDLPNDLLNVFEEGRFTIPELERLPDSSQRVAVMTADGGERAVVERGQVWCTDFPIVVITSNGEREFPPAFLRRCIRVAVEQPTRHQLAEIVEAHLGPDARTAGHDLIGDFLARRARGELATDQLLNAIFLATSGARPPDTEIGELIEALLRPLDAPGSG